MDISPTKNHQNHGEIGVLCSPQLSHTIYLTSPGAHLGHHGTSSPGGKFLPRENDFVEVLRRDGATGWTYGRLVGPATEATAEGWLPDWWLPAEDADWMQDEMGMGMDGEFRKELMG